MIKDNCLLKSLELNNTTFEKIFIIKVICKAK